MTIRRHAGQLAASRKRGTMYMYRDFHDIEDDARDYII